jgi:hypothetical protein
MRIGEADGVVVAFRAISWAWTGDTIRHNVTVKRERKKGTEMNVINRRESTPGERIEKIMRILLYSHGEFPDGKISVSADEFINRFRVPADSGFNAELSCRRGYAPGKVRWPKLLIIQYRHGGDSSRRYMYHQTMSSASCRYELPEHGPPA